MTMHTIVKKARELSTRIERTVVECAKEIADDIWNTFGEDLTTEQAKQIGEGAGDGVAQRASEWKVFAEAVPFGMAEAISAYSRESKAPTLTRVRLFGLARKVKAAADYTHVKLTVSQFVADLNAKPSKGAAKTPAQKLGMGLGIIKNLQTRSPKVIEFRRKLAALCKEYDIAY